jgi:tRNA threonylcarbamoyl adenosine modification protein YeaZ/ribosomal-protein-alanine acetyltransferase
MLVVALETVTRAGSLALWRDGTVEATVGDATRMHAARLPGEIMDLLARHQIRVRDVDVFAVVSGPGSFTGLRVGLAAIQGLTLASGRPALGVPTLEALAHAWRLANPSPARIVSCLDGQRGEVFYEVFDAPGADVPLDACQRVVARSVGRPIDLASALALLDPGRPMILVGDGAVRYADVFAQRLPGVPALEAPRTLAEAAASLAAAHPERAGAPHALQPIYVRRPDAEVLRDRGASSPADRAVESLVIRRVGAAEDLGAVDALQQKSFDRPWGGDAFRWELEHSAVARLYLASTPDGDAVGYCACWVVAGELHVNNVAVDPARRRRGIARRLLHAVIAEASAEGATSATLEVRSSNVPARKLYEALGFRVEAVRRDYYQDPREDALILWRRGLG